MNMPLESLTALQIFHGLGDDAAHMICDALETQRYGEEQIVLKEGDCVQSLWIILKGECVVSRACSVNQDHALAILTSGDVFGEMSFVRTAPHSATICAATELTVCAYRKDDYLKLAAQHPEAAWQIASNIAAVLSERLRRMDTWVCDLFEQPDAEQHRDEWKSFRSAVYTNWNF